MNTFNLKKILGILAPANIFLQNSACDLVHGMRLISVVSMEIKNMRNNADAVNEELKETIKVDSDLCPISTESKRRR